jgi:hypothetical protein
MRSILGSAAIAATIAARRRIERDPAGAGPAAKHAGSAPRWWLANRQRRYAADQYAAGLEPRPENRLERRQPAAGMSKHNR